jgi:hypothetical protein
MHVGKKTLQDDQENRPEFPLVAIATCIRLRLNQVNEERLRQILRIVSAKHAAADERVERRPVIAAQVSEGIFRADDAPAHGRKCRAARVPRSWDFSHVAENDSRVVHRAKQNCSGLGRKPYQSSPIHGPSGCSH